jgi:hypothetical protein
MRAGDLGDAVGDGLDVGLSGVVDAREPDVLVRWVQQCNHGRSKTWTLDQVDILHEKLATGLTLSCRRFAIRAVLALWKALDGFRKIGLILRSVPNL